MKLSLVIPAYNEEENIAETISAIEGALDFDYEIIVINDHSQDTTGAIVSNLMKRYTNVRLIDNDGARGFANTLRKGFSCARGELIIPVMADLCDDVVTIKAMVQKISEGFDVVCGSRYMQDGLRLGGSKIK